MLKCSAMPEYERNIIPTEAEENSESFIFQKRDDAILSSIHEYDGVLARRHIKSLFWPERGCRAMEVRLSKLHQEKYIQWPTLEERKRYPIPEPILWLDWRGALHLAHKQGIEVPKPKLPNENQLRTMENSLRAQGFTWLREPRWSKLCHDLTVVDTRFWINTSMKNLPSLSFGEWINESSFHSQPDYVDYKVKTRDGKELDVRRGVCPDGYFTVHDQRRMEQGEMFTARFLVEIDMATHDNPSIGMYKVIPGIVYLKSKEFSTRFGGQGGRWLVITTSPVRINHLIRETQRIAREDANLFFFTYFENCRSHNFFTDSIWLQGNGGLPRALIQI